MPNSLAASPAGKRRDVSELSIALVAGLGMAAAALFLIVVPLAGRQAGSRDFISYWATGQQLVRHGNPYDRAAIAPLEHAAGLVPGAILIMRNPPWALPLVWPLGFLGLRTAALAWSLLLAGGLLIAVRLVRRLHGSPPNAIHWLGFAFTPALICLFMGQTALLALLGLAIFLRFHRERPFAAGLGLWLCALKPHLFLPFGVALAVWIVYNRAWKILAGAVLAIAATSALAFAIDPRAWSDYARMLRSPLIENEFIPCLADALRHWLWPRMPAMRYLPVVLACAWAVMYFWKRRKEWNWTTEGGVLMLVSLLLAPYCWLYDQCLAIPALLGAAYSTRSRAAIPILALMILAADFELCGVKVISPWWLWTAPAWLGWYLLAMRAGTKAAH